LVSGFNRRKEKIVNPKISGAVIVRNGVKLGYPFVESIKSILPLCDEALVGVGDSEDDTRKRWKK